MSSRITLVLLILGLALSLSVGAGSATAKTCPSYPSRYYLNHLTARNVSCGYALTMARSVNRWRWCSRSLSSPDDGVTVACTYNSFRCTWFGTGRLRDGSGWISDGHYCQASHGRRVRWGNVA